MTESRLFQLRHRAQVIKVRKTAITLGRRLSCDIVLHDPRASRCHARIIVGNESAAIEDTGSANGVYVNGLRVKGLIQLTRGDRVSIGEEVLDVLGFVAVAEADEPTVTGAGVAEILTAIRAKR